MNPQMREIALDGFGQAVLEEVLFRAGEVVHESDGIAVGISIAFSITCDSDGDSLAISLTPPADGAHGFTVRLPRPF